MNQTETLQIMAVLRGAYPAFYQDMVRKDAESVVALWTEMFAEEDVAIVAAAVKALIATDDRVSLRTSGLSKLRSGRSHSQPG